EPRGDLRDQRRSAGRHAQRADGGGCIAGSSGVARGGRRTAARDCCPPLSSGRPAYIRDNPPELSENLGDCRSLRLVAGGYWTLDQESELFRKQVVFQFRLRLPAQHGGNGRQSLGPRAAAV